MLLTEGEWVLPNAALNNRMIQCIVRIEIRSMSWLHNDTNENPIIGRNILEQKRVIDGWLARVSKYPHTSIIALTCALIYLDNEKIAK